MRDSIVAARNNPSVMFYEGGNKGISEDHMAQLKAVRDQFDPHGGRAIGSREMLASKVDLIIALGPATWAAKRATSSIPIVVAFSGDPVGNGVVPNLAHPGGNITGFSYMSTDLAAKRLELIGRRGGDFVGVLSGGEFGGVGELSFQ